MTSATWTVRHPAPGERGAQPGSRARVAVKDAFDMAGEVTTAGCVPVRDAGVRAVRDADCLAGLRTAEAGGGLSIVGRTATTELCLNPNGVNRAYGTPVNPLDPERIPGGSSSGSAVAVASGEADIALGTDTGGSVRIPAACCGIVGLKTTWGRIPLRGVWPLAPSLDTVGPLARDVAGVVAGMRLLEPGWRVAASPATTVGRLRIADVRPSTQDAVDAALTAAGLTIREVVLDGWAASSDAFDTILLSEFWQAHRELLDAPGLGGSANRALRRGSGITPDQVARAVAAQRAWQAEVARALAGVDLLALPTLVSAPPRLSDVKGFPTTLLTAPVNTAGLPALSLPVTTPGQPVPPSLQLVAAAGREDLLCATGLLIEAALAPARGDGPA